MKNRHTKAEINHSFKPEREQIITHTEDSISKLDEEKRIKHLPKQSDEYEAEKPSKIEKDFDISKIDSIIDYYNSDKEFLISILQDIQAEYNYLPQQALCHVSEKLNLSLTQIYGVATFFKAFSLVPKGKHIINVCLGTACHVRRAANVLGRIEQELGIKNGGTTEDMQFSLETVNCLGACALGPIMVVDDEYYGNMNPSKVTKILKEYSPNIDADGSVDE